ncbi:phage holin family protein [Polaromonas jejuensis]|uniref:Phage holin family protein n=1 Tax=Polaromonas jejuensis TaxID=457502 RepID=A0ABW0Q580_9BURK|nr:phage holin family protein [Polaromonas jejuensis]
MASAFGGKGPLAAVRDIAATLLATLQTRLALLANEVQVEKHQILQQLTLGLALVFCLGLGVLLAVALVVLLWWEQRLAVLGFFSALFLGLAAYCYAVLRRDHAASDPLFAASLAELQEDLRQLKAAAHEQKAD